MKSNICSLVCLFTILLLAGCASPTEQLDAQATALPTPVATTQTHDGGSITIASIAVDKNPLMVETQDQASLWGLVFEGLFQLNVKRELEPKVALQWETSEDGLTWNINLRPDVLFHHGMGELTADDVLFTLGEIMKPDSAMPIYRQRLRSLTTWEGIDAYTIRLQFTEPVRDTQNLIFPILCKSHYEGRLSGATPVGTGPYEVTDFSNLSMTLSRYGGWWHTLPHIQTINVVTVKDSKSALQAFDSGKLDIMFTREATAGLLPQEGVNTGRYVTRQYEFIGLNHRSPLLSDKAFRQAMARAVDRKALIQSAWLNKSIPVDVPFAPDSWLYDVSGYAAPYEYNAEEAQQLLMDMGWYELDHVLVKDGKQALLKLLVNGSEQGSMREDAAKLLAKQLEKVGIKVEILLLPWQEYLTAISLGDYDLMMGGYEISGPDLRWALHSSHAVEGGSNITKYRNPEIDVALEQLASNLDKEQLKQAAKQLQSLLMDDLPYISLCFRTGTWLARDTLHDVTPGRDGDWYQYIYNWYIYDDPLDIRAVTPIPTSIIPDMLAPPTNTPLPTIREE